MQTFTKNKMKSFLHKLIFLLYQENKKVDITITNCANIFMRKRIKMLIIKKKSYRIKNCLCEKN